MPFLVPLILAAAVSAKPIPTVIMIHGAGGGAWEYRVWRARFQHAGYPVVARDLLPGRGGLAQTRFEDYVSQVESWLPKGGRPFILVGASMGGVLALKVAEFRRPQAVVLANSVPPAGVITPRAGEPYSPVVKWAHGPMKDTRDAMPDSSESMIQFAYPRWRDESGAVMNALRKGIVARKPACPVLVIVGAADGDVPPDDSMALAAWCAADIHRYAAMSHVGPLLSKRAAEVADAAIRWIRARS